MRLSVIIPGYNTPNTLWRRCVKSVLAAIGPEDEIILIDDCSCDPVTEVGIGVKDSRMKIIRQMPNQGQSAARNKALELAQGDYITFVDSDDEVEPNIYLKCFMTLAEMPRDVIVFGVKTLYVRDGLCRVCVPECRDMEHFTAEDMKYLTRNWLFDTVWSKLFRREFLNKHRVRFLPGICPGEDTMFVLDCVLCGASWVSISTVGYLYYRTDGTSLSRYQTNLANTLKCWKEHWDVYMSSLKTPYDGWWPTRDYSQKWVDEMLWNNLWMRGSPISLNDKWDFLLAHKNSFTCPLGLLFAKKAIYTFLRLNFYIRPIRRWHLKRRWSNIRDIKKGEV